jgi:hypothetical protein
MARVKLNVGACKKALKEGIGNLRATLEEDSQLTLAQQIKFKKAILDMSVAHAVLNKIPCIQPVMDFETRPYQKRRAGRPTRSKGRKR